MTTYNFDDTEAILTINPLVVKQFEESKSLYDVFKPRDLHPWKSDIRQMAKWLEKSHSSLPHKTNKCTDCSEMHKRQIAYTMHKLQQLREQGIGA